MRPILVQTLKDRRWFIFWWSLGVLLFVALTLSVYPSIRSQSQQLNQSFTSLSPSIKSLITDTNDLFSPVGYLSSQIFYLMQPLLMSILAIGLGSSVLARDEQNGTLELLLSRPISRSRVLVGKALAVLVITAFVTAISIVATVGLARVVHMHGVSSVGIAWASFEAGLIGLLFGSLALLLTALGRVGRGASIGIAALLGFASYIISSLAGTAHWLRGPARALPYYYYHPSVALSGHLHYRFAAALCGLIVLFILLAVAGFRRRDIG